MGGAILTNVGRSLDRYRDAQDLDEDITPTLVDKSCGLNRFYRVPNTTIILPPGY
jgi:hypothetical protein